METNYQTLADYYEGLPRPKSPKTEFIRQIAKLCNIDEGTVRNWVKGRSKPSEQKDLEILSEHTGISIENLFKE